jgi:hypothetical protein
MDYLRAVATAVARAW